MKIRIKGNTLRLRLSQTELKQLSQQRLVDEVINFGPDQSLHYSLQVSDAADTPLASYTEHHVRIVLPESLALTWINSDQVSIRSEQENGTPSQLGLLIEKDFRCLTERPGENEEDLFPHPKEDQLNC